MTLQEVSMSLPNGFHDAELLQFSIDYVAATAFVRFDLWVGLMSQDETDRERYAKANLLVSGVKYCVIEKPEINGTALPSHLQSCVDDFETATQPEMRAKLPHLESDAFAHSFFVNAWNSFIHIGAQSAELVFDDGADKEYVDSVFQEAINAES